MQGMEVRENVYMQHAYDQSDWLCLENNQFFPIFSERYLYDFIFGLQIL